MLDRADDTPELNDPTDQSTDQLRQPPVSQPWDLNDSRQFMDVLDSNDAHMGMSLDDLFGVDFGFAVIGNHSELTNN